MSIRNLRIGTRLQLGFGLVLALLLVLALSAMERMSRIQEGLDRIVNESNVISRNLGDMRMAVMTMAGALSNIPLLSDDAQIAAEAARIQAATSRYQESFAAVGRLVVGDSGKAALSRVQAVEAKTAPGIAKATIVAKKQGDISNALKDLVTGQRQWIEAIDALQAEQDAVGRNTVAHANAAYDNARMTTVVLAAIALLLGSGTAWYVTRTIVVPLRSAVSLARCVASGDLTTEVKILSHDETGEMMQALKDMNASLVHTVSEVRHGTETINQASREIARGNGDLSARTEMQASSLQETASSMEQLTGTVRQNADNAQHANQLAASASEVARRGGSVVTQVVATMGSIKDSSNKIVDIISVIDGIAFQTNILALNAAVEAARAGEQGRGFAVVAAEVRNLAQRSAGAAKEIKALINDSVEKVDVGSRLVDEAGKTMDEIMASVKRVTDIMTEITAASQEQSSGIVEVNRAIAQMDEMTQRNAALVEEAAAAAESMHDEADRLAALVSRFRIATQAAAPSLHSVQEQPRIMPKPVPATAVRLAIAR